jgi:hypothetical protein
LPTFLGAACELQRDLLLLVEGRILLKMFYWIFITKTGYLIFFIKINYWIFLIKNHFIGFYLLKLVLLLD